MGLFDKFLKADQRSVAHSVLPSGTQFQDSDAEPEDAAAARTAVRRELVQVTLRESMRHHAVPSDWLEVRMLPVVSRRNKNGLHVQLVVKQGQGNLLRYIPAFQSSFMAEIEKFDPRAWEWLLSISWQFAGITSSSAGEMPAMAEPRAAGPAMGSAAAAGAAAAVASDPGHDDLSEDLQALFAIRDAALQGDAPGQQPDFEPTRPGEDS
ncbi:hypothetical protein PE066_20465 [Ramlibacter tataouinensis]|uniref:hypothetical protein n=1 Tax=Ramlibacter tataouinensis TaxID=94132 RepID=UPI0022F3D443|nr:hypothetical protein [Ramlibacter tataouinensis]WBY01794.1 hypothetical protein PE066_20465 [Ramlibacter tataouinensis]